MEVGRTRAAWRKLGDDLRTLSRASALLHLDGIGRATEAAQRELIPAWQQADREVWEELAPLQRLAWQIHGWSDADDAEPRIDWDAVIPATEADPDFAEPNPSPNVVLSALGLRSFLSRLMSAVLAGNRERVVEYFNSLTAEPPMGFGLPAGKHTPSYVAFVSFMSHTANYASLCRQIEAASAIQAACIAWRRTALGEPWPPDGSWASGLHGLGPGRHGSAAKLRPYLRAVLDEGKWERPGITRARALGLAWEARCHEDAEASAYLFGLPKDLRPSGISEKQMSDHRKRALALK